MKSIRCLMVLAAPLLLAGCGKQDQAPPPAAPAAAPSGYIGAMVNAQQAAIKVVDLTSLNHEIDLFNAQEGHYPKDLNELVTNHYIGQLPAAPVGRKIVYDAAAGKVSLVKQ